METISANPSTFTRAAASSMASGSPSTRRDTSAASARSSASGSKPGRAARARSRKSSTAAERAAPVPSSANASGAMGTRASLATRSASRLVARIRTAGHCATSADGDPRCLVENVLTRVEDDERAGVAKT